MPKNFSVRLEADTSGFTQAIDNAKRTLEQYSGVANQARRETEGIDNDMVRSFDKLVNSLGKVGSAFRTAKQDADTMRNVLKHLEAEYERIDEVTKNGDYGKALRQTIDSTKEKLAVLKEKTDGVKTSTEKSNQAAQQSNNLYSTMANKLGISASAFTKVNIAVVAVTTVIKVLTDAFKRNEENMDALDRTLMQASATYDTFLNSINSGNWSGFFSNINNAINRAARLHGLLDQLDSYKNNNQAAIAYNNAQITRLNTIVTDKTGKYTAQQKEDAKKKIEYHQAKLVYLQNQTGNAAVETGKEQMIQELQGRVESILGRKWGIIPKAQYERTVDFILSKGEDAFAGGDSFPGYRKMAQNDPRKQYYRDPQKKAEKVVLWAIAKAVTEGEESLRKGMETATEGYNIISSSNRQERKENTILAKDVTVKGSGGGKTNIQTKEFPDANSLGAAIAERTKLQKELQDKTNMGDTKAMTDLQVKIDELDKNVKEAKEALEAYSRLQRGEGKIEDFKFIPSLQKAYGADFKQISSYDRDSFQNEQWTKGNVIDVRNAFLGGGITNDAFANMISDLYGRLDTEIGKDIEEVDLKSFKQKFDEMKTVLESIVSSFVMTDEKLKKEFENTYDETEGTPRAVDIMTEVFEKNMEYIAQKYGEKMGTFFMNLPSADMIKESMGSVAVNDKTKGVKELSTILSNDDIFNLVEKRMQGFTDPDMWDMWDTTQVEHFIDLLQQLKAEAPLGSEEMRKLTNTIQLYNNVLKQATDTSTKSVIPEWMGELTQAAEQMGNAFNNSFGKIFSAMAQIAQLTDQAVKLYEAQKAAAAGAAITESVESSSKAPWPIQAAVIAMNLAAVLAGLAEADKFAQGGIVKGNGWDNVPIMAHQGEMILNESEQARLFRVLKQGGLSGGVTSTVSTIKVNGSDLYLTLRNYLSTNKTKKL